MKKTILIVTHGVTTICKLSNQEVQKNEGLVGVIRASKSLPVTDFSMVITGAKAKYRETAFVLGLPVHETTTLVDSNATVGSVTIGVKSGLDTEMSMNELVAWLIGLPDNSLICAGLSFLKRIGHENPKYSAVYQLNIQSDKELAVSELYSPPSD